MNVAIAFVLIALGGILLVSAFSEDPNPIRLFRSVIE